MLGAVVALHGQCILLLAGDTPFGGDVLGGHAHMDGVERVVQGTHYHVNHLGVSHAGTPAHVQGRIGATAHVFCTTANGDIGVTQQNALAGADDGLQAGAAEAVDVESGRALGTATVDGGHTRQVHVFGLGIDHMAKHHVSDVFAFGVGAGQGLAHHLGGQIGRGDVFQTASKGANGGAHGADDYNFTGHGFVSFNKWFLQQAPCAKPGQCAGQSLHRAYAHGKVQTLP